MLDSSDDEPPPPRLRAIPVSSSHTGLQANSSNTRTSETHGSSSEHRMSSRTGVSTSDTSSTHSPQPAFGSVQQSQSNGKSLPTTDTTQNSSSGATSESSYNRSGDSFLRQTSPAPALSHEPSKQSVSQVFADYVSTSTTGNETSSDSFTAPQRNDIVATLPLGENPITNASSAINPSYNQSLEVFTASNLPSKSPIRGNFSSTHELASFAPDRVNPGSPSSTVHSDAKSLPSDTVATSSSSKNENVPNNRPIRERFGEHKEPERDVLQTPRSIRERILNFEKIENSQSIPNRPSLFDEKTTASPVTDSVRGAEPLAPPPQNNSTDESPFQDSWKREEKDSGPLQFADSSRNVISFHGSGEDRTLSNQLPSENEDHVIKAPPPLSLSNRSPSADRQKEYTGYNPKTTADFIVQSIKTVSRRESDLLDLLPSAPIPTDSRTHCVIAIPAIVTFIIIGIILIPFAVTPAICRLGVCEKIDRSSLPTSKYIFQTFEFSAPLGFLLIPLSIQLFCFAILFVLFRLLVKGPVPEPPLATMTAHIQYTVFRSFYCVVTIIAVISFPAFIVSGFSSSWNTAFAFIFGLFPTICSPYIALVITTRASSRMAANFSESILDAYTHAARAAAVVPLTSFALTLFSLILCYNAVRDVRALVGFILGTALPTLFIRVSVAIFANFPRPSESSRFNADDVRNPAAPLPSAAAHLTCIAGNAAQLCATFATPIVAAAILASSLPYFERNPLAMCVQNHLDIDRVCVAYSALKVKFSFAIGLCRLREFFDEYPSLTHRESVSALVAVPFVIGVCVTTLALGVAASTLRTINDPRGRVNLQETDTHPSTRRRLIPFLGPFLKKTFFSSLMMLLVIGILVLLLVGPLSPFHYANREVVERYVIPETSSVSNRCMPRDSPEIGLLSTEFPRLEIESERYRPIDGFGERLPVASGVAWRIFVCAILGLLSGITISVVSGLVSSSSHRGARRAAVVADEGLGSDVTAGVGMGVVVGAMAAAVVTLLTLVCHHLFGGFGVGICAVGMTHTIGMIGVTDVIGLITRECLRLSVMCGAKEEELRGKRLLCIVGECMQGCGRTASCTSSLMGTIALLWVLIENTGVIPSPRDVIDDETSVFTRHITDVDRINFLDRGILPATIFGLVLPFLVCAILILTACRASNVIGRAIQNEMLKRGPWEQGEYGDYDRCVRVNLRIALVDTIIVFSVAITGTMVGALWYGRRGWIAMAIGAVASGNILSLCAVIAGTRVEGMRLSRLKLAATTKHEVRGGRSETRSWTWEEMGAEWVSGCVTALLLFIASSGTVVVRAIPSDGKLWWVGFIVAGAWILSLMVASAVVQYVEKEADHLPDGVVAEDQYDVRVNSDAKSPFFEEGPKMDRTTMNRLSVLRHVETGGTKDLDPLSA